MNYYQRIFAGISFLAVATISSAQISYTDEGLTIGGSRGEGMGDRIVVRDAKGLFWQNGNDNVAFDLTHSSVPIISPSTSVVDFMSPSGPGVYEAFYCRSVFQEYRPLSVTSGRMSEQVSAVEGDMGDISYVVTDSDLKPNLVRKPGVYIQNVQVDNTLRLSESAAIIIGSETDILNVYGDVKVTSGHMEIEGESLEIHPGVYIDENSTFKFEKI